MILKRCGLRVCPCIVLLIICIWGGGGVAKVATVERVCGDDIHVAYYFDVAEWEA